MATRPLPSPPPPLAWRSRVTDSPVASTSGARCVPGRRRPVPATTEAFHFRDTAANESTAAKGSSSASRAAVMTDTARGSGASASLRGLAFTSKPENIDPARAAALLGRAGDDRLARKLARMLAAKEACVIGAFARVDADETKRPGRNNGGDGGLAGIWAMGFDMLAGEGNIEGKTLVGFAHAATDGAMVATVDFVVVHPRFRANGLGRKLVKRLADELRYREIFDIGVRAPPTHAGFFAACNFGPDAEGAVLMSLPLEAIGAAGERKVVVADASEKSSEAWVGAETCLRTLGEGIDPGRTLKDGGEGLRAMLLGEMDKMERERADRARWPL